MTKKDKVEQKMKLREQNELFRRLLEEAMERLKFFGDNHTADRIKAGLLTR